MDLELCNDPPSTGPALFYECRFYWLSNFSAFAVQYKGETYPTSEHAYQAAKFPLWMPLHRTVQTANSAHEAMMIARENKGQQSNDWDTRKRGVMKDICRAKMHQHEYIRRKLPLTKDRVLIEASPVDSFWGWGPDRSGRNELGKIWMELREELAAPRKHP